METIIDKMRLSVEADINILPELDMNISSLGIIHRNRYQNIDEVLNRSEYKHIV